MVVVEVAAITSYSFPLKTTIPWRNEKTTSCSCSFTTSSSSSLIQKQTGGGQQLLYPNNNNNNKRNQKGKGRMFFLDVNPLCYNGSTPSLNSFAHWISLFFSQVSHNNPVIAVLDGEGGNEYRRDLLPSYKAHRRKFTRQFSASEEFSKGDRNSRHIITDVLQKCNVPVLKIEGCEADDVVATLVEQVLCRGFRVVIGSPDKDFKQLISEDVQIVMPMPEFGRWSFYTLKHYIAQYSCDPSSDLSLRCIMGDEGDGVPGIQHVAPGFGRKTALKLLKKHGSLENLLNAAAVRTVGKQYVQDALSKHADYLRKNYNVLSLRRDIDVHLEEDWLSERDTSNDAVVLSNFVKLLGETQKLNDSRSKSCCFYNWNGTATLLPPTTYHETIRRERIRYLYIREMRHLRTNYGKHGVLQSRSSNSETNWTSARIFQNPLVGSSMPPHDGLPKDV